MRMIPSARASSKFPLLVSKAIVVVIVRVYQRIFPPSIIDTPTSPMTLPNPDRSAERTAVFASIIMIKYFLIPHIPRVSRVSGSEGSLFERAL